MGWQANSARVDDCHPRFGPHYPGLRRVRTQQAVIGRGIADVLGDLLDRGRRRDPVQPVSGRIDDN